MQHQGIGKHGYEESYQVHVKRVPTRVLEWQPWSSLTVAHKAHQHYRNNHGTSHAHHLTLPDPLTHVDHAGLHHSFLAGRLWSAESHGLSYFEKAGSPHILSQCHSSVDLWREKRPRVSRRSGTVFRTNEKSNICITFQHCWYLSSFRLAWCWS